MAETLPNQPILFDQSADCWLEDSGMNILAEYGDITQFQMKLSPCGSDVNVISNGNFANSTDWTVGASWSISGGQACHTIGIYGVLSQFSPATDGTMLRITFDLVISQGSCLIQHGNTILNIFESGSYEYWYEADSCVSWAIACNGSSSVCISNLQVMTINTNFSVVVLDVDGAAIAQIDTDDGYFNFDDGYFTCSIDWEALSIPEGCYFLAVIDPCPCAQRGIIPLDFVTGLNAWSLASSWLVLGGTATYNGSSTGQAILNHVICDELTYTVQYTISGMGGNEEFNVRLGAANGVTRTSDGTYTEQITSSGTSFIMIGNSTSGTQTFEVTSMYIEETIPSSILYSNTIEISEAFDCKTLALSLCNDSDGLGFGFANTGFAPLMRIPASLNRSSYPMERLSYDNSIGRKATYYGRSRKAQELGFDGKELMHDFASLFGLADHFYIDGEEYFVEDDEYPSISWSDGEDSGGVTINVSKKIQLIENKRLSSASVGCEVGGSILFDSKLEAITDQADSPITTP